jgi:hypothetical protein
MVYLNGRVMVYLNGRIEFQFITITKLLWVWYCTWAKLIVMTIWERLLVAFMLVEAVVLFTVPCSIKFSISL